MRRQTEPAQKRRWLPLALAGFLLAGLAVAALRVDLIRVRYGLADAVREEKALLEGVPAEPPKKRRCSASWARLAGAPAPRDPLCPRRRRGARAGGRRRGYAVTPAEG